MLSYEQARQKVIEQVGKKRGPRVTFVVSVWDALGLVLQQEVKADRAYPPFHRSTRDGYAVRAAEARAGAKLRCAGEIKAGDAVTQTLAPGICVQIMTGAAGSPRGGGPVIESAPEPHRDGTTRVGLQVCFARDAPAGQQTLARGAQAP